MMGGRKPGRSFRQKSHVLAAGGVIRVIISNLNPIAKWILRCNIRDLTWPTDHGLIVGAGRCQPPRRTDSGLSNRKIIFCS